METDQTASVDDARRQQLQGPTMRLGDGKLMFTCIFTHPAQRGSCREPKRWRMELRRRFDSGGWNWQINLATEQNGGIAAMRCWMMKSL